MHKAVFPFRVWCCTAVHTPIKKPHFPPIIIHTANEPVLFAGYRSTSNTSLATVASNTTFVVQPDQPNGNALVDFGNEDYVINVQPGAMLVFRGIALQGLPPNFVEPPMGHPSLKNEGLLTWPAVLIEPGATVGCLVGGGG